jgi:hypothetical protein
VGWGAEEGGTAEGRGRGEREEGEGGGYGLGKGSAGVVVCVCVCCLCWGVGGVGVRDCTMLWCYQRKQSYRAVGTRTAVCLSPPLPLAHHTHIRKMSPTNVRWCSSTVPPLCPPVLCTYEALVRGGDAHPTVWCRRARLP